MAKKGSTEGTKVIPLYDRVVLKRDDAESKTAAMERAGIEVSPSPARIGKTLVEVLGRL